MEKLSITGGARIGMRNSTWPFATLNVTKDKLELIVTLSGTLTFYPKDIISIEPYSFLPLIGQGVKINHKIANYNKKIIFWTSNPKQIINQIKQIGFFVPLLNA